MAVQQDSIFNRIFQIALSIYRNTLKRFRPLHRALHWLMLHVYIPLLERMQSFYTMPDDPFWFRIELLTGKHETETRTQLEHLLQEGMTMLDIGAHVGYYSRLASNIIGEKGQIVAFEPHPRNHAFLTRNVGKRDNIRILQVALAEEEGTAELYDYLMMSASGSLNYDESLRDTQMAQVSNLDIAPRIDEKFEPQVYTVRTAPVDKLLAEQGITQVDVVKMDIEGAEMGALRGMRETIRNSPNLSLVMEYNPMGLKAFGNNPVASLQEVLAMGFQSMYVIEDDSSLTDYTANVDGLDALTTRLVKNMGVVNMLFTKR